MWGSNMQMWSVPVYLCLSSILPTDTVHIWTGQYHFNCSCHLHTFFFRFHSNQNLRYRFSIINHRNEKATPIIHYCDFLESSDYYLQPLFNYSTRIFIVPWKLLSTSVRTYMSILILRKGYESIKLYALFIFYFFIFYR